MAILVLEDDEDLRSAICEVLSVAGSTCVAAGSFDELKAHEPEVRACSLALLDVNLGPNAPSGVRAYEWLRAGGFTGPIMFLTGHGAEHPEVRAALETSDARVLRKPLDAEALMALGEGRAP